MGRLRLIVYLAIIIAPLACSPPRGRIQAPVSGAFINPPTCGGGPRVNASSMGENEMALANLINDSRQVLKMARLPANSIGVGLAQWHARDMANNSYLGFVGSDGEDALTRFVCSGGPAGGLTGLIAIGSSSDPQEVFNALQTDFQARGTLYGTGLNLTLSVGYYQGYWMIVQQ